VSVVDDQQKPEIAARRSSASPSRHVDLITGMVFSNVLLPVMPAILNSGTIYLSTNTAPKTMRARSATRTSSPWPGRTKTSRAPWAR